MSQNSGRHSIYRADKPLKLTLAIVVVVMVAEFIGGILSNSLALLSDAGHMLTDALSLGLTLFAVTIARKLPTKQKTFGYLRAEILAALFNGALLVLIAFYIFYEAYQRFSTTTTVNAKTMLLIGSIGLIANIAGICLLRRGRHTSLNIKASFWHIIGDTLSSLGVIIASVIILTANWYLADPIIAIVIGGIILWGAIRIVKEATDILLESTPEHIQILEVISAIKDISGVIDAHDMHIWTITSGVYALSTHLIIEDQSVSQSATILEAVNQLLADKFDILHSTIQFECPSCPIGQNCTLA